MIFKFFKDLLLLFMQIVIFVYKLILKKVMFLKKISHFFLRVTGRAGIRADEAVTEFWYFQNASSVRI